MYPLTRNMAKPSVSFGGAYRIIDFTLSNCINSHLKRIFILTQYKSLELNRHIRYGWAILSHELGEFVEVIPPMKRVHDDWYLGTADAIYQNIESIEVERPEHVLVLSADHIYKMDYREMMAWHKQNDAGVTIATLQIEPGEASRFGVAEIDGRFRVRGFEEKPLHTKPCRSVFNPEMVSASMGIYLFNTDLLLKALREDAADADSAHDFGRDILPKLAQAARVIAYDFRDLNDKTVKYWRDVGTLDALYEANIDLVSVTPEFNLYDDRWPIRTLLVQQPPAKFVFAQEGRRMGIAIDSIVAAGCIVSGGRVSGSVLSPGVRVNSYCEIEGSILMPNVEVGRYSRIQRAIIDSNVKIPESSVIGFDPEQDLANGHLVTAGGVTVVSSPTLS